MIIGFLSNVLRRPAAAGMRICSWQRRIMHDAAAAVDMQLAELLHLLERMRGLDDCRQFLPAKFHMRARGRRAHF